VKINLIIGGTEKGGTTSLYNLLKEHPKVLMPRAKELHFFSDENYFTENDVDYQQYHRMFFGRSYKYKFKLYYKYLSGARIFGDASPEYMWWNSAPHRVYQYNPLAKWLILLRNPIDRAFSHYKMNVFKKGAKKGHQNEQLSFMEAIIQEKERCKKSLPLQDKNFSYMDKGLYSKQLKNIYKYFDKNNVYVETSDVFKFNTFGTVNEICNFLGIDDYREYYIPKRYDSNIGVNDITMTSEERQYLVDYFKDEVKELEVILQKDLSFWLK